MGDLIVVSGLPRSGTSMMMAALQAGGLPLVTDDLRPPDPHNPRGYFECQAVRRLAEDNSWLEGQRGRAVKIIYRLLYHLPPNLPARILFMERPLAQILRSQQAMLGQSGEDGLNWNLIFTAELARVHDWIGRQPQLKILRLDYAEFLARSLDKSQQVAAFLQLDLDVERMAAVADPRLHRQRQ